MALPINIEQLLKGNIVEWERLDFKEGWNPEDVVHTMAAFANDIHNWGGGYIVVGVKEQNGTPILPPKGLPINELDAIQKELVSLTFKVEPYVTVVAAPMEYMGKMLLVIYVPGGENRPYKAPIHLGKKEEREGKVYFVRQGSVTRRATTDDESLLLSLAAKIPFDDRVCHQAEVAELSKVLIGDFLKRVGSSITESDLDNMPLEEIGRSLHIVSGSSEYLRPKNVGVLFFSRDPEKYIPYARIELVRFGHDVSDVFEEKILHGPLHLQLENAMNYLQSQIIMEKVIKVPNQSQALRVWNYPYGALEEVVANAVYHKSYDDRNPIEISIYPDKIQVYSLAGPMPPITNADLKKERVVSRNYRNRRIGDFLKELDMTEGRSTGFPKIYRELRRNGSPMPVFETDDHNAYFLATIYIHPEFLENDTKNVVDDTKNDTKNDTKKQEQRNLSGTNELDWNIIEIIMEDQFISSEAISKKLGKSRITIKRHLKAMQDKGIIRRAGPLKGGYWMVVKRKS